MRWVPVSVLLCLASAGSLTCGHRAVVCQELQIGEAVAQFLR